MKLSQANQTILSRLQKDGDWHMEIAARKAANDHTLPAHFSKSADYYAGLAWGKYSALETVLHAHKVYRGFACTDLGYGFEQNHYFTD